MHSDVRVIATPQGDARLYADRARRPVATLVLGHGAGKGVDSRDLEALADALPRQGISVFRIEQPWHRRRQEGRRRGRRCSTRRRSPASTRSGSARRSCSAVAVPGRGSPAGWRRRSARSAASRWRSRCTRLAGRRTTRLPELVGAGVPTFVVQGERDAFGGPSEFPSSVEITSIPDADHGFAVPKRATLSQEETLDLIVEAVVEWITRRGSADARRRGMRDRRIAR